MGKNTCGGAWLAQSVKHVMLDVEFKPHAGHRTYFEN